MSYTFRGKELPPELEESLRAYVETGRPTGGFLEAVICNNLSRACSLSDDDNGWILPVIHGWLYNEAPAHCWGKPDSFDKWIERKASEREKRGVVCR